MTFPVVDGYRAMELGSPGDQRSLLTGLVLDCSKRATAGLLAEYAEEGEPVESVGERLVLVDDDLTRLGLIEVTRVDIVPLCEVTWDFAQAEGEGFADLADWREAHESFWIGQGVKVTDATQVTCIYFDLVDETRATPGLSRPADAKTAGMGPMSSKTAQIVLLSAHAAVFVTASRATRGDWRCPG